MRARKQDAIAAFRVEAVGIRAVRRGVDADVQEAQILRKYGCKFHDGEFWNVTPCTVTFLQ